METINSDIFGEHPKVKKAVMVARNISSTKAPVLIIGEVGVGKRTLGTFIHQNSSRACNELMVVECSADAKSVENEILGYRDEVTGKFHKGALENANGGTVIFANIDSLEEEFQKKLHKIINELSDYEIDIRIIATTTKNISKLVGTGRFYRGLYTYISANSIILPPLRERSGDLEMLSRHFANHYCDGVDFDESAIRKILGHYWTYNVEELRAVVESSIANCNGEVISEEDIEIGEKKVVNFISNDDNEGIRLMSLKDAEKLLIKKALIHTSENRTQAAKILGVSIRTLRNKINEYRSAGSTYFINLR